MKNSERRAASRGAPNFIVPGYFSTVSIASTFIT